MQKLYPIQGIECSSSIASRFIIPFSSSKLTVSFGFSIISTLYGNSGTITLKPSTTFFIPTGPTIVRGSVFPLFAIVISSPGSPII